MGHERERDARKLGAMAFEPCVRELEAPRMVALKEEGRRSAKARRRRRTWEQWLSSRASESVHGPTAPSPKSSAVGQIFETKRGEE